MAEDHLDGKGRDGMRGNGAPPDVLTLPEADPDRLPPLIRPAVDFIARIRATVHTKLLAAFLVISVLLVAMGVMSILVIGRMNQQADQLIELQHLSDLSRQGIYGVTAQSHFRAMALITRVDSWNDKIAAAKVEFANDMDAIEAIGGPGVQASIERIRQIDERFAEAGVEVLALYEQGDLDRALDLHISAEHEISHELEDELNLLIDSFVGRVNDASSELSSLHRFLMIAVGVFAGISLLIALALGAVFSWSLIRPVRKMDHALARIADGDFEEEVQVPNRDEFGRLTVNLNRTRGQLAKMYKDLEDLNENLEHTVEEQLAKLRQAEQLRRYLAPQVADAVLSGGGSVTLSSTRRNLSILVATIRGFASLSERLEPEELIDGVNKHFSLMTDVVFRHGGTMDKYVGDGILSFFGDPIPFDDHAERAVVSALEMRQQLRDLRSKWPLQRDEELNVGIGISTGYVTVGNIGSDTRTEYTVIGNHVNLASRLAQVAGPDQILVSERTLAVPEVKERVHAAALDEITLEGFLRPVGVFEITDQPAPLRRRL
ncbi:MAG: adenylate/guanylate cyclase domain-containing protein [Actinomycetota bacterium]